MSVLNDKQEMFFKALEYSASEALNLDDYKNFLFLADYEGDDAEEMRESETEALHDMIANILERVLGRLQERTQNAFGNITGEEMFYNFHDLVAESNIEIEFAHEQTLTTVFRSEQIKFFETLRDYAREMLALSPGDFISGHDEREVGIVLAGGAIDVVSGVSQGWGNHVSTDWKTMMDAITSDLAHNISINLRT